MPSLQALLRSARLLQLAAMGTSEAVSSCAAALVRRAQHPTQQLACVSSFQQPSQRSLRTSSRWLSAAGGGDSGTPSTGGAGTDSAAAAGTDSSSSSNEMSTAEAGGAGQVSDQEDQEEDLTPEEQVRQAIAMLTHDGSGLDSERPGKKPRRKDIGSYADFEEEIDEELDDVGVHVPEDIPIYDLRDAAPQMWEPSSPQFEELLNYGRNNLENVMEQLGMQEETPPYAGAQPILRWEVRLVLDVSSAPSHPANRKAKCRVFLRDLQQETALSDDALKHIALIAGPRYNPDNGELTLVSEKTPDREENRRHIMDMLHALVEEGHKAYPATEAEAASA